MKVTNSQFWILSLLTVCAILWLLLLTCFREYWGFWQSPDEYRFLSKEYPQWFREYIRDYYEVTLWAVIQLYAGWLLVCFQRFGARRVAILFALPMTLFLGMTLGVLFANNLIHFLDSGQVHGNTHLQTRE